MLTMNKLVIMLLLVLLTAQVKATEDVSPRDLIDEVWKQHEELSNLVQGNILLAHSDLLILEGGFLTNSNDVLLTGLLAIHQEQESINQRLTVAKDLAAGANKNISFCTFGNEDTLNELEGESSDELTRCIFERNREANTIVADATYIVDTVINRVHTLEFQLKQCNESLLCLTPLLNVIQQDKIRLPNEIRSRVSAAESLLDTLRLSVQTCSNLNVTHYTTRANSVLQDIIDCINWIVDG